MLFFNKNENQHGDVIKNTVVQNDNIIKETTQHNIENSDIKNKEAKNINYIVTLNNLQANKQQIELNIPEYNGKDYIELNNNIPFFDDNIHELSNGLYESYMTLDDLGRCGSAIANVSIKTMPIEIVHRNGKPYIKKIQRGEIGTVKPSGWKTYKFDNVDGKYLYNRCHLLGYQLTAENANRDNLITGTRYFNVKGMLPFENMVADYVNESIDVENKTSNHVLYRVTPIFYENDLVAKGVIIEAQSIEDMEVQFCVFVYNIQPDIKINYADGTAEKIS
jgi:hypothetical protein